MAMLFLIRHGETSWNTSKRLTGNMDISINENGQAQALRIASQLRQWPLSVAYVSGLRRTHQTLDIINGTMSGGKLRATVLTNLDERDCGAYTGLYKADLSKATRKSLDEDWDYSPPGGESLATVYTRVIPVFKENIVPQLLSGKNVLVVSHYNPMRLLIAHLDGIPKRQSGHLSVNNGALVAYSTENTGSGRFLNLN